MLAYDTTGRDYVPTVGIGVGSLYPYFTNIRITGIRNPDTLYLL